MKRDLIYVVIILILAFFTWKGCSTNNHTFEKIYNQSQDSLRFTRNKLNEQLATTNLLYGSVSDLKKLHASDSSTIGRLQKMVNKNTISATSLAVVTNSNINISEQATIVHDTITSNGVEYLYPEYRDTIKNKWETVIIKVNKDSAHVDYKIFNEFDLKQEWKSNGLFKRKTAIASVLNLNPNTETLQYKTFTVKEDKSNRFRDFLIGVLAASIAFVALK